LHRPPTPKHPRDLGKLASGARLSVIDYAGEIDAKLNPRPLDSGGTPALHFTIKTAMMGQQLESWLLADNAQNGNFAMGLANIELKRGKAEMPTASHPERNEAKSRDPGEVTDKVSQRDPSTSLEMTDLEESIFVFAKMPDQISHVAKGGGAGAKISFSPPLDGDKGQLTISLAGKTQTLDVAQNLKRDVAIAGTPFTVRIENYWADLRIQDGKPVSLSDAPNNPAVVVIIRGRGVPIAPAAPNAHGSEQAVSTNGGPSTIPNIAPTMNEANAAENHLMLFVADDGAISYELDSRKLGHSSGPLELNKPLVTGWADWQLVVDRILPHAEQWMDFTPAKGDSASQLPDGIHIRVEQNGETFEQWISAGWQITVPTSPNPIGISYGWRSTPLPIALELMDFEVERNEGSDAPAGFKSTLRVSTADGDSSTGQCWMNHPFSFPGSWWRTWSGLTFKMSQASWNPENLGQSTIQILRDPGWLLKWIGSLLIVTGVFLLFYVKRFRRQYATAKTKRIVAPSPAPEAREVVVS